MLYDAEPRVIAVTGTLFTIASILFFLRLYVRTQRSTWGWDDWSMSVAYVPLTVFTAFCIDGAMHGIGAHASHLTVSDELVALRSFFFAQVFYCISILFVKLSIGLMLCRIAERKKPFLYALYLINVVIVVTLTFTTIYLLARCNPIKANWDPTLAGAKCLSTSQLTAVSYAQSAFNIITDWSCAILPVPLLWDVKMNKQTKGSVVGILSLGFFASVSAMIRLKYTVAYSTPGADYLYNIVDLTIWAYCEASIGMIVGCVSTLRPLLFGIFSLGSSGHENLTLHERATRREPSWPNSRGAAFGGVQDDVYKEGLVTSVAGAMHRTDSDDRSFKDTESQERILGCGIRVQYDVDVDRTVDV